METKTTEKITVKKAVEDAYNKMTIEFSTNDLIVLVRSILNRPYLHDGSILRELRRLRADGVLDYKVMDQHKSIYVKRSTKKQLKLFDI